jgi:PKD repeat protein
MKGSAVYFIGGLLMAGSSFFSKALAQDERTCGTDHVYQEALRKDPSIANKKNALEEFTKNYVKTHAVQHSSNTPYIIPTVVHIIHNWGPENISDAQVKDAIRIANEDLRKLNADTALVNPPFIPIIGNMNIELRLAQIDPDGNCTNGITRTASPLTFSANDNVKQQLISWDNSKYLNIWVVQHISFNAGGYAYYPGTAPPGCEGVVVLNQQFGGIGQSCGSNFCKRTLTHELGHYFNLAHTWGSSNTCGDPNNCSIDDGVADTPDNVGNCQTCNLNANTCGFLENVENYMDYATCTKMFTQGQAMRSDAALNSTVGWRLDLWQPANLVATGTDGTTLPPCIPTTYFSQSALMICAGDSIHYTDLSWNANVTSWSWNFPGGTPSTSSFQNPTVTYNIPGTYNVSLTAGTASGTMTYTRNNAVYVSATSPMYSTWQYFEGFEQSPLPNANWLVVDTNFVGWQRTINVAYSGVHCAYIDNLGNTYGDVDQLISPSYDLTTVNNPSLYFRVAYAQVDTARDLLRVLVSTNCGKTWQPRYAKYGSALSTVGPQSNPFVPSNFTQWRMDSIGLPQFANQANVRFKFEFTSRGGNNIYLDDINLSSPLGINETQNTIFAFSVFPNPSRGSSVASFKLSDGGNVTVRLTDVLGREVLVIAEKEMSAGEQQIELNTAGLNAGVYFVTLNVDGRSVTEKLLVQ